MPMALESLGARLKELRVAQNLSQQALATMAGLSVYAVSQIEQGVTPDPRISTLHALAKALGVTLNDLAPTDLALTDDRSEEK